VSLWLPVVPDLGLCLEDDAMSKPDRTALIEIMLELSDRAIDHRSRGSTYLATECSTCADIVEKHLTFGWFEQYEREQAALQKSTVSKSRKSTNSGIRVRKSP
jgi:hypothetical protein